MFRANEINDVCLCGPRSVGSVTGVALAFDLLVRGLSGKQVSSRAVDATRGGVIAKSGTFSLRRAWDTICVILLVWRHLLSSKSTMRPCRLRRSVLSEIT